ncbi:Asp-tRNA(Asn)/Glu-tRNA(Gln) amidotransferase subunit GatA [Candidatus Nomurabacteria bacterium]|nr:Asp-tRNA(Asn)/Glu-tRNA(Gln) amidotransferase subunit GatA [Candidatus Nomurabacteria bacterium]
MKIDLNKLTIKSAHEHLMNGDFSVVDLTRAYLENIKNEDKDVGAYREIFNDAVDQAEKIQARISNGDLKDMLAGIPFAIKDNILIKGKIAGACSKILENYVATYDATVIKKLKEKGVVFIGRTNMDEFAMGGSTENSAYGPTKNPHDHERVAGGSSGGSIAAVAINGALCSLSSDTGGSIREPASFCGVVGLKPTYGSVSRYGLIAMASSFDVIGPATKTVEDAEIVFNAIKGKDEMDSTSSLQTVENKTGKLKIGIPYDFLSEGVDKDVLENFNMSVKKLESLGYEIVPIELPSIKYSLATYYIIVCAEVSSNMARFDVVKFGSLKEGKNIMEDYLLTRAELLGREVKRRIILGTYVLSTGYYDAYYSRAWEVRNMIKNDFKKAFEKVDAIALPVSPTPAFKIGEKTEDPLKMYLADIFTVIANLAGIPAMSVPSGTVPRDGKKLPVGLQIMASHFCENTLFEIGKKFERI